MINHEILNANKKQGQIKSKKRVSASDSEEIAEKELYEMLAKVQVGMSVAHKIFGIGKITWMSDDKRYLRVKFAVGEKQFAFPGAFTGRFLRLICGA